MAITIIEDFCGNKLTIDHDDTVRIRRASPGLIPIIEYETQMDSHISPNQRGKNVKKHNNKISN